MPLQIVEGHYFFYKMGGPGRQHLYKMERAKKTVQNERAYTKTGDS